MAKVIVFNHKKSVGIVVKSPGGNATMLLTARQAWALQRRVLTAYIKTFRPFCKEAAK